MVKSCSRMAGQSSALKQPASVDDQLDHDVNVRPFVLTKTDGWKANPSVSAKPRQT